MNNNSQAGLYLTLIEAIGDTSLKQYAQTKDDTYLYGGIASYNYLAYILQDSYKKGNSMGITNSYWDAYSGLLTPLIGGNLYNEKYTQKQLLGMGLITFGISLLE